MIVQSSTEFKALTKCDKDVIFYLIGTPFNPVLDENYTNIPSNIKLPSKQKKLLTVKCSDFNEKMFVNRVIAFLVVAVSRCGLIDDSLKSKVLYDLSCDKFTHDNNPFIHFSIDYPEFVRSLKAKFRSISSSKNPQAKSRFLNNYNAVYRQTLHTYFHEQTNLNFNWHKDYDDSLYCNNQSDLTKIQEKSFDTNDVEIYEAMQTSLDIFPETVRGRFNSVLTQSLIGVKQPETICSSIRILWQICYDFNIAELFLKFYLYKKNLFSIARFPFMHIEVLESASKQLNDDDQLKDISIRLKLKMFLGNFNALIDKEMHPMFLSLKLKELVQVNNLPSIQEIIYFLNVYFTEFDNFSVSDRVLNKLAELPKLKNDTLTSLNQAMSEVIAINASIHNVNDCLNILQDSYSEEGKHKTQLESINKEAVKLAENPLENLEALQALKLKQIGIKNSHPNLSITLEKKALQSIAELCSDIQSFNKLNIENDKQSDELQSRLIEVEQLNTENKIQKETIHQLNAQMSMRQTDLVEPHIPRNDILAILKTPSIANVIKLINGTCNSVVLSNKAKAELTNATEFKRLDLLFNKLSILASKEFIQTYENKGSLSCFDFLTKKELSFQESKSTRNKNIRNFDFEDGVSRDCKAHLKICSGFNEQNTLRIYFSIEQGTLYIGALATHLEVATT